MSDKQTKLTKKEIKDLFGPWKEITIQEAAEIQEKLEWNGREWVEKGDSKTN